jgi:dolichol-phosphate mannosyltransferase
MNEVPAFDRYELAPKMRSHCICVFVINEGRRLLNQLERMKPFSKVVDIIVADGGSTDGSTKLDLLRAHEVNSLLVKTGPGRLGAQMRMAFSFAIERGYEGVVTIDGNGKDGVEAIPLFVTHLMEGHDHIQGSRFIEGGESQNLPFSRWLGVKLVHAPLVRGASCFPYTDTTNGFRGYSSDLLCDVEVDVFRNLFAGYELHYYLAVQAAQKGYRVVEVPVKRRYPSKGPTPSKISPLKGNIEVLRLLAATCIGKYDTAPKETSLLKLPNLWLDGIMMRTAGRFR